MSDFVAFIHFSRELRAQVETAAELLGAAEELRVTSPAGTDVTYRLNGGFPVLTECGHTATPGRWDHWPAGSSLRTRRMTASMAPSS